MTLECLDRWWENFNQWEYDKVVWTQNKICAIHAKEANKTRDKSVCCLLRLFSHLHDFEVFSAAENSLVDNSSLSVLKWLIETAGLTAMRGRILYTYNWYTTMELATNGWRFCWIMSLTEKRLQWILEILVAAFAGPCWWTSLLPSWFSLCFGCAHYDDVVLS